MQLRKLLLPGLLSVTLLSGCSLFSGEEDVVKMSPLPTVENQFTPSTAWDVSVGNGIGDFYSNLHPAYADSVVYAADRKGTVKAVNADDGKEVWSVNLAEKDGWFSRKPALLSGGLTVAGGHVYVGSEKAQVYALNSSDGSIAWQTTVAGESLSRPVVSDGLVTAEYTVDFKKTQSQTLLPMIDEVTRMLELDLHEIDAIAVSGGPGSFTGLRIGSATAKGLGLALNKPLIHVPTLDATAYNLFGASGLICPIMDARRNQVYTGIYRFEKKFETVMDQDAMDMGELIEKLNAMGERVIFLGDGVPVYEKQIAEKA